MTQAPPVTLAEFLRTRLDEDATTELHDLATCSWANDTASGVQCDCGTPARVLAEVEAKRRIVDACMGDDPDQGELDPRFDDERIPATVLRLLALPYAGHPDYRSEWAP